MSHKFYSQRVGKNQYADGLPLTDIIEIFVKIYDQLESDGYFTESFGFWSLEFNRVSGKVEDVELEILLMVRKKQLWPVREYAFSYAEDDLLDLIEFLFQHVSKPIASTAYSYGQDIHWKEFDKSAGQEKLREKINSLLSHYKNKFELSINGEVLQKADEGFEQIFKADIPSKDSNITSRINAAITNFRRHNSSIDDRRQAVRDLADVLEYLKSDVREFFTKKDEGDLFNIANNFGLRHHNEKQKTTYDAAIWLSWMFYFYLSTIHVLLRKIEKDQLNT